MAPRPVSSRLYEPCTQTRQPAFAPAGSVPPESVNVLDARSTPVMRRAVAPSTAVPLASRMSTVIPSTIFLTESAVTALPDTDATLHSTPEPSPKSIRPKLKAEERTSPSISAVSRSTNAPALLAEARTALSLISTVP